MKYIVTGSLKQYKDSNLSWDRYDIAPVVLVVEVERVTCRQIRKIDFVMVGRSGLARVDVDSCIQWLDGSRLKTAFAICRNDTIEVRHASLKSGASTY